MTSYAKTIVLIIALFAVCQPAASAQMSGREELPTLNQQLQDFYRNGKYADAIPIAKKILYITEIRHGAPPLETTVALNNLALLYILNKRYLEAEDLSKRALHVVETQLGINQPTAASTFHNLAEIYEKTGRLADAERFYRKSEEIRKNTRGMTIPRGSLKRAPPPERKERAAPPPMATPANDEPLNAFWNTWFENWANGKRGKEPKSGKRVEELKTGNKYFVVIDISRLSYFKDAAAVGPRVEEVIQKAKARGETTIRFTIRPILHGNFLRFTDKNSTSLPLIVDINKLLKPKDISSIRDIEQKEGDWEAGRIELYDFARLVQAGEVAFEVLAKEPGNATISVSIWDETGIIPLDHLTLSARVTNGEATITEPGPGSKTVPLKAGLGTLLDVSFDFSSTGPLVADAAFYIFEPGPEGNSIVLFVARKNEEEKEASDYPQDVTVYAWETKLLLSKYIEDKIGFLVKINNARKRATDEKKFTYDEAASELREMIFSGIDDNTSKEAEEAQKAFSNLVQRKKVNPIVFVRMRNENGNPVYLPLGILAAQSENPILDKRIVLVQPLPRERYPGGEDAVEGWTFGLPEKLDKLTSQSDNALRKFETINDPRFRRNIKDLRRYLETISDRATGMKPEGILVLAHQEGGYLWYTEDHERITVPQIKHRFAPGSVAILSACSVASATGNNQAILKILNEQGIDAMIISPFPVDANYGTMLAVHIVETLEEVKNKKTSLTMAELFSAATAKTKKYFNETMGINFADMDLEFLIAGDYRIRIIP